MSAAIRKLMTADEFLVWCLDQEETYELVNGVPVLKFDNGPEMMAGAASRHDQIVVNLITGLRTRLRGGPCRTSTADQGARMTRGNLRRPDVTVDCGPRQSESLESIEPAVFFEVLSPSTRQMDLVRKLNEYRDVPTLRHFVMLEPDRPKLLLWTREDGDWRLDEVSGLDAALALPGVGVTLPMAEVYEDVELTDAA